MIPFRRAVFAAALGSCGLAACGAHDEQEVDTAEPDGPIATITFAITVEEAINAGCSTTSVKGLSEQIVGQMNCLIPGAMADVPDRPNMTKSAATFAFMQPPARDALVTALDANPGMTLGVNSMFRTVAQQYLLWRWGQSSSCGIGLAATPGNSNHESGLALDTSQYSQWRSALEAQGFEWFGSADAVHFDYRGPGVVDLKGQDVLAFQMLWNINNPSDTIAEDGDYGPQTAARLSQSPAEGFATGPMCSPGGTGGTGGTGGAGGSGGTGGVGGTGGTPGSGGTGTAGSGTGGDPGVGGSTSTGGTAGDPGAGGTGGGNPGEFGNPGCTAVPDCNACVGCMNRCLCEAQNANQCLAVCVQSGSGGSTGTAGSGTSAAPVAAADDGGCGCRVASPNQPARSALWLTALLGLAAARRRRSARSVARA